MRIAFILSLLASVAWADRHPRFERFCSRSDQGRTQRGFNCTNALFEAFGPSGAGTFGVCSTATPTGQNGEPLTFTRASAATCTRTATGGQATSGIAVGDLINVASGIPRVEFNTVGTLGILVENAGTNDCLRSEELDNVAWTSTAAVTANAATPPNNTAQLSNAEQLSDVSAAAFQGSCQTITTSSATVHTFYAYVRAGTATTAQVTMTGTGSATGDCSATVTGLSGTTWNILSCTSPAAYGGALTAVTVCVNVGDAIGITGTIMAWGADHKVSMPYVTSYNPTSSGAVTRAVETAAFMQTWPTSASISMAATYTGNTPTSGGAQTALEFNGLTAILNESGGLWRWYTGTGLTVALSSSVAGIRTYGWHTGTTRGMAWAANVTSGADVSAANKFAASLFVGGSGGARPDAIISNVCVDTSDVRCR